MIAWMTAAHAAELWFVPEPELAEAVREATAEEWPQVEHQVVVGPRPEEADGWSWDGAVLSVVAGTTRRSGPADDADVAVLLARTWAIRTESPSWEQWVPDLHPAPPPPPDPGPPPPSAPPATLAALLGLRSGIAQPGLVQVAVVGLEATWGVATVSTDLGIAMLAIPRVESRGPFAGDPTGYHHSIVDRTLLGGSVGLRSPGKVFVQGRAGYQERWVDEILERDAVVVDQYRTAEAAFPVAIGAGARFSRVRPSIDGWWRTTVGLPPSFGVDLQLALVTPPIGG